MSHTPTFTAAALQGLLAGSNPEDVGPDDVQKIADLAVALGAATNKAYDNGHGVPATVAKVAAPPPATT